MEIIIRADDSASSAPAPAAADAVPADLLARAAAANAINVGPAPQPPGGPVAPPAHIVAEESSTTGTARTTDVSAGPASV